MIQLSGLHKSFGGRTLFDKVSWHIQSGNRVGLCGANGAGKTTLLKMMAGDVEPDGGSIARAGDITIGYLPQDGLKHAGHTLYEEASKAFESLLALQREMISLEHQLADTDLSADKHDAVLARYSEVQHSFQDQDGYSIDAKVNVVLKGLGFSPQDLTRQTEHFSGGWQMRIALAKLLLQRPKLLLLDEPTNHLDLEARNWLEEFFVSYPHAIVLVSHDRFFLDSVVTAIAEVGMSTLTTYPGTYSSYLIEREERITRLRETKRRQDEEVARMRMFIDRFRYQATKAKQVQSRIKMLEKIKPIKLPPERKRVHFKFPSSIKSGRIVMELQDINKQYGDIRVFKQASLSIDRGDRVAIVGPNGAGKSTLMRILSGVEAPDDGTRTEGHNVVQQYFAQDEATNLNPKLTIYETLASGSPINMVPSIRNILGGFLFTEDDVHKHVKVLSGGERTRLAVARMLLRPSNTLLLDEPTNHLDIDSTNVLLEALADYGGTLIFVSHDRYFVDHLATKIIEVGDGNTIMYPGTYEEFRWSKDQQLGQPSPPEKKQKKKSTTANGHSIPKRAADHKRNQIESRRHKRIIEARQKRITELENRIADCETTIRTLETEMSGPDFYADKAAAEDTVKQHQNFMWKVGDLMNQWEALEAENVNESDKAEDTPKT